MPGYVGFQIALELSQLLPIKALAQRAGDHVLTLARDLRKSGSDIVVEQDLVEVFGRGKISSSLEIAFKNDVKIGNFIPLTRNGEVELHSGPGPTVAFAFKNAQYLSTVIQLSLLSWTHKREELGSMIAVIMRKRFEVGIKDAAPNPGVDGIIGCLQACCAQTSAFNWSIYSKLVQEKLREAIPTFQYHNDYIRITPALMLGAVDMLYLTQSLPDDRRVVVSNEMGSITLIVWAHFVLGLTVCVTGRVREPIFFGHHEVPEVTIEWTSCNKDEAGSLIYPHETEDDEPEIRLLDSQLNVLLSCVPEKDNLEPIMAEDRHILLGYGTEYLYRVLNTRILVDEIDPIYEEMVKLVTGLAIVVTKRSGRPLHEDVIKAHGLDAGFGLEAWRALKASQVIFHGIKCDTKGVSSYAEYWSENILHPMNLPTTFKPFLAKVRKGALQSTPGERLVDTVSHLTQIVTIFAHVADIGSCHDLPLRMAYWPFWMKDATVNIQNNNKSLYFLDDDEAYHAVATLLSDEVADAHEDRPRTKNNAGGYFSFLWSDFGWSVMLSTIGDQDPAEIRPELVQVKKGTPTNIKTQERKPLIKDGRGYALRSLYPDSFPLICCPKLIPRCAAKISSRIEFWSSRRQEFELIILLCV
ncbi:uncharacterized protein N7484_008223 [Penicillium longicatenatum]|uniref:uncharacterized protein n=1 Tax=Penicillium longicatenatum TaxID=1561947 RepID=UPI00254802E3|nr:uncharacterized protein N7484_008223 [Penicillium longicatenatum]KAJ5640361.1 hypothetical protein N7484_008223 [Penicillium longicatenatum]